MVLLNSATPGTRFLTTGLDKLLEPLQVALPPARDEPEGISNILAVGVA